MVLFCCYMITDCLHVSHSYVSEPNELSAENGYRHDELSRATRHHSSSLLAT